MNFKQKTCVVAVMVALSGNVISSETKHSSKNEQVVIISEEQGSYTDYSKENIDTTFTTEFERELDSIKYIKKDERQQISSRPSFFKSNNRQPQIENIESFDVKKIEDKQPEMIDSFFTMEGKRESEIIEKKEQKTEIEKESELVDSFFAMEEKREPEIIEPQFYDGFIEPEEPHKTVVINDLKEDYSDKPFKHVSLVSFEINKAVLSKRAKSRLKQVVALYNQYQDLDLEIEVIGHADFTGSEEFNHNLASNRAMAATTYLIDMGVRVDDIYMSSMAYHNPAFGERESESERSAEIIIKSNY
ncbi:OmpA family protein [Vibrio vulnificus]